MTPSASHTSRNCSARRDGRWLAIVSPKDAAGLWAITRLAARVGSPMAVVTPAQLALAARWEHRLGSEPFTSIRLASGVELRSDRLAFVFNRLDQVEAPHWRNASATDQGYVAQELHALYLSWLASLRCSVVNPPTMSGLAGPLHPVSLWRLMAARSGLSTLSTAEDSEAGESGPTITATSLHALVVGDTVFSSMQKDVSRGLLELAAASRVRLMSAEFVCLSQGEWLFSKANPYPDLRPWGEPALAALASLLQSDPTDLPI